MARGRLPLVVVLVLPASRFLTADKYNHNTLCCITFVKPGTNNIVLNVHGSSGTHKITVPIDDDCSSTDAELLTVKVARYMYGKFLLDMRLGECGGRCMYVQQKRVMNISRPSEESVKCLKDELPRFNVTADEDYSLCTFVTMKRSPDQHCTTTSSPDPPDSSTTTSSPDPPDSSTTTSSPDPPDSSTTTSAPPHPPTQPSLDHEDSPPPPTLPTPAVVLLTVLVVQVAASFILGVGAVVLIRRVRNKNTVVPAHTVVRRAPTDEGLCVCENDLYEPSPASAAAAADQKEEEEQGSVVKSRGEKKKEQKRNNRGSKQK